MDHALQSLPVTLDATYERMLNSIEEVYRPDALTLLRWLAYGQRPLTLSELMDATTISTAGRGNVDEEDRGGIDDVLEILSALVTVEVSLIQIQNTGLISHLTSIYPAAVPVCPTEQIGIACQTCALFRQRIPRIESSVPKRCQVLLLTRSCWPSHALSKLSDISATL